MTRNRSVAVMNSVQHEKYEVMVANQRRLDGYRRNSMEKQRLSQSILLESRSVIVKKSQSIKSHLDNIY